MYPPLSAARLNLTLLPHSSRFDARCGFPVKVFLGLDFSTSEFSLNRLLAFLRCHAHLLFSGLGVCPVAALSGLTRFYRVQRSVSHKPVWLASFVSE